MHLLITTKKNSAVEFLSKQIINNRILCIDNQVTL